MAAEARPQHSSEQHGNIYRDIHISGRGQLGNTYINKNYSTRLDLPYAEGAEFDSYADELDARCLPDTRVDLLQRIKEWANDPQGRCIFWLCGVAGTGKSTISRTVAQSFADGGQLAASFFFKRGEGDRGNASRFFTTIAYQLTIKVPKSSSLIGQAIEADPSIIKKSMKDQLEKLILQPLSKMPFQNHMSRLVIVIDALDECEREGDIRNILNLLARFRSVTSICLHCFVTSRPELPIRLGFKDISTSGVSYQDVILTEIPRPIIKHDIAMFLKHEFNRIRNDRNIEPSDWPGEKNLQILTDMAIPLFIFAATVCRYIGEKRWNPRDRLQKVLDYQTASQASKLDRTYLPILDSLLVGLDDDESETLIKEFQDIVGSIVLLATPLSKATLARLLQDRGISEETIECRLDGLHSVLSISDDRQSPVRLLHLSFREFLVDPQKQGKNQFWVNEKKTHKMIATRCIQLMSKSLKENICDLKSPGVLKSQVGRQIVDDNLPVEVQYACGNWVHHLQHSENQTLDHNIIYTFLSNHLLHWLEALSLIERLHESIEMIRTLITLTNPNRNPQLADLLLDIRRFVLKHRTVVEATPLQLYSSALVFSPKDSLARKIFQKNVPSWICRSPEMQSTWNAELQTLEGHTGEVYAVAFSPDGQLVASGSDDKTVRLWDAATGAAVQTLEGHTDKVGAVTFSPDGQLVASGSDDETVRLWDAATGAAVQTLEGHTDWVGAVTFSPDGQLVASGSDDNTIRLWDAATGAAVQTLDVGGPVKKFSFSVDGSCLQTNRGRLSITVPQISPNAVFPQTVLPQSVFVKHQWIGRENDDFFWLPPEYRSDIVAVHGNVVALGLASGRVCFFEFAPL